MTNLPDDIRDGLRGQLERHHAHHCIQLAPHPSLVDWDELGVSSLALDPQFDAGRALAKLPHRAQLAIVIDAPSVLSRDQTRQLLGRLRNYAAGAIIAAFAISDAREAGNWSVNDFLGLGFRRFRPSPAVESAYWLYRYDIYDYKITPDWLNSRHWANPGQWGKHRW